MCERINCGYNMFGHQWVARILQKFQSCQVVLSCESHECIKMTNVI